MCHPVDIENRKEEKRKTQRENQREKPVANKSTHGERSERMASDGQRGEARVSRRVSDCNMAPRLPLAMATREK